MKLIVVDEVSESCLDPSVKGKFGLLILQFELPEEEKGFQQYQRALKHPKEVKVLADYCESNGMPDPPMETRNPLEGKEPPP